MVTTLQAPVLMRNTQAGPTVFRDDTSETDVTWLGAGDPMGRDVQAVPVKYLENVNFIRILSAGILEIEEASEDIREALRGQLQSPAMRHQAKLWSQQHGEAAQASVDRIERTSNNDYVTVPCIGPGSRGSGECGEPVAVRETAKDERPALCPSHVVLEPQYVMSESDRIVDGKAVKLWTKAGIDTTLKQHHNS